MRPIDAHGSYTINASDNTGYSLSFGGGIISVSDEWGHIEAEFDADDAPTIDPESMRPHGRCRYCSKDDGSGLKWDFDDIEVSVYLQGGVLTISNQYGEEAEMPINYCPYCGAKMKGAGN